MDFQARRRHRTVRRAEVDRTQEGRDPKRLKMKNDQSGECFFFFS